MNLDELADMRRRHGELRAALESQYPIRSRDEWLHHGDRDALWHVAFDYACLPTIGEEVSAFITLRTDSSDSIVAWEHRWGLVPNLEHSIDDHTIGFASGNVQLNANHVRDLHGALTAFWVGGNADLPTKCYDGTPVSLAVSAKPFIESKTAACNLGDSGKHATRHLAKLAVGLLGCDPGRTT